ncbi:MAG: PQQ-binding-like beta-propeller repeat protein [Thermoplasmatota archaeon]
MDFPDGDLKAGGDFIHLSDEIGNDTRSSRGSTPGIPTHLNWKRSLGGEVYDVKVGVDGLLYVTSEDQYLRCIDSDGSVQWEYEIYVREHDPIEIGPDGCIYITDHYLLKCIGPDGMLRWEREVDYFYDITFASDGSIIIYKDDTAIECLFPNGSRKWIWEVASERRYNEDEWWGRAYTYEMESVSKLVLADDEGGVFCRILTYDDYRNVNQSLQYINNKGIVDWRRTFPEMKRAEMFPLSTNEAGLLIHDQDGNGSRMISFDRSGNMTTIYSSENYLVYYGVYGRTGYILLGEINYNSEVIDKFIVIDPDTGHTIWSWDRGDFYYWDAYLYEEMDMALIHIYGEEDYQKTSICYDDKFEEIWNLSVNYSTENGPLIIDENTILHFNPDNRFVFSNSSGQEIFNFSFTDIGITTMGYSYPLNSIDIDENGNLYIAATGLISLAPDGSLRWIYNVSGIIETAPVLSDNDSIHVGSLDGNIYKYDTDGDIIWKRFLHDRIRSTPVLLENDRLIVATFEGNVFCLNESGDIVWNISLDSYVIADIVSDNNDRVYIGTYDNCLFCIDHQGNILWNYSTPGGVYRSPAVSDSGAIYIVSSYNLTALNPDGSLIWNVRKQRDEIISTPVVGNDGTIYATGDGLYAFDEYGNEKWNVTRYYYARYISLDSNDNIYTTDNGGEIFAYHPNGSLKWKNDLDESSTSRPVVDEYGYIYVKSKSLTALHPNGTIFWRYLPMKYLSMDMVTSSSPVIGMDGSIFITNTFLHSIGRNGSENRLFPPEIREISHDDDADLLWKYDIDREGCLLNGFLIFKGKSADDIPYHYTSQDIDGRYYDYKEDWDNRSYYRVQSFNPYGLSTLSDVHFILKRYSPYRPSAPRNFSIKVGAEYLNISWDPPQYLGDLPLTGYRIYRTGKNDDNYTYYTTVGPEKTYFIDRNVTPYNWYYYRVAAENDYGWTMNRTGWGGYPSESITLREPLMMCGIPSVAIILIFIVVILILRRRNEEAEWYPEERKG